MDYRWGNPGRVFKSMGYVRAHTGHHHRHEGNYRGFGTRDNSSLLEWPAAADSCTGGCGADPQTLISLSGPLAAIGGSRTLLLSFWIQPAFGHYTIPSSPWRRRLGFSSRRRHFCLCPTLAYPFATLPPGSVCTCLNFLFYINCDELPVEISGFVSVLIWNMDTNHNLGYLTLA